MQVMIPILITALAKVIFQLLIRRRYTYAIIQIQLHMIVVIILFQQTNFRQLQIHLHSA